MLKRGRAKEGKGGRGSRRIEPIDRRLCLARRRHGAVAALAAPAVAGAARRDRRGARRAREAAASWEEIGAADFPLPSFAALADDIRVELEDGSGIVLLQGLEPGRYSPDEQKLLYAGLCRHIGTLVYSNRAGERMREIRDVTRDAAAMAAAMSASAWRAARCRHRPAPFCPPMPAP